MKEVDFIRETQERLASLKVSDPKKFLEWNWYCTEMLGLNPNRAPYWYLDQWLQANK